MPRQETFLTTTIGDHTIEVIKTYDQAFAKEAFAAMDDMALAHLAESLDLAANFAEEDIPSVSEESYRDFIWKAMINSAREDGNVFSYFVVTTTAGVLRDDLFISGDWPTAEAYVKLMGTADVISERR